MQLFWISLISGLIFGIILALILYKLLKYKYWGAITVYDLFIGIPFSGLMLFPPAAGFINSIIVQSTDKQEFKIIIKTKNTLRGTKFIFIDNNGYKERLQPKHNLWNEISENDTVILTLNKGIFGYERIIDMQKK